MSTAAKNIYGKDWQNGETYHSWNQLGVSSGVNLVAGAGYNDANWVTVIRFEISSYTSAVTFAWRTGSRFYGKGQLKYRLTDKEDAGLINANYNTAADGVFSPSQSELGSNKLTVSRILAPGTYYLYLWQGVSGGGYTSVYFFTGSYGVTVKYEALAGTASTLALSGGVLGQPVTMQITRNNTDFVHTLNWSFAGQSGVIAEKTADTLVTWTPDADTFGAYIPTASSGVLTVSCTTYYDEEQIGAAQTATLTLSVPADAAPVLHDGWAAVSHTNDGTAAAGLSACIAGYSKAVVTFDESKVAPKYGASVKTLTAAMGGSSVTGGGVIGTVSGTANTVTLTATDTRGKSSSQSVTLAAYPYSRPLLSGVTVFRCDSAGAADDSGAFYSAKAAVTYSAAGGEIGCTLTAAAKAVGGSYGDETALASGAASVLGGWLSDTATYYVRIQAVDTLGGAASVEVMIPTAQVAFHIRQGGDGMGFGKYGEVPGAVDSAWSIQMNGNRISGLGEPTEDSDAVTKGYADGAVTALREYAAGAFAPAGYGLGGVANSVGGTLDADAALETGWYSCCLNTPTDEINNEWYHVLTIRHVHGIYRIQIAWSLFYTRSAQRLYLDGQGFTEWEWINPPMRTGVEYRTTERFNNKAVYVKVFDFGALPKDSYKYIEHGLSPTAVVALYGFSHSGKYYFPSAYRTSSSSAESIDVYMNASRIVISTVGDWSEQSAYIIVKYTKD